MTAALIISAIIHSSPPPCSSFPFIIIIFAAPELRNLSSARTIKLLRLCPDLLANSLSRLSSVRRSVIDMDVDPSEYFISSSPLMVITLLAISTAKLIVNVPRCEFSPAPLARAARYLQMRHALLDDAPL